MDTDLSTPLLLEEASRSATRLQEAWPWLAEALIPGTVVVVERIRDVRDIERDEAEHRKDRAAAFTSTQAGIVPSGPHASAVRIAPAAARAEIAADIRELAEQLWAAAHDEVLAVFVDPTTRQLRDVCGRCLGAGLVAGVRSVFPLHPDTQLVDWAAIAALPPDQPIATRKAYAACPDCEGTGQRSSGVACVVCHALGPCTCDLADAVVTVGLLVIGDALPRITDPERAADAARVLDRADHRARRVAGVGEDERVIKAPCPACGRRGDFVAEVSNTDRRKWVVRCKWAGCFCDGPGCGCGRPVRYRGRRHLWPASEWNALAERLGVDLADIGTRPKRASAA